MTTETFVPVAPYTVAGTGPYAIGHDYTDGAIRASIVLAAVETVLVPEVDFTVSPDAGASGNLTLESGVASTYAGGTLTITRETTIEQGFAGQTTRESAVEAQLDRNVQVLQELDDRLQSFEDPGEAAAAAAASALAAAGSETAAAASAADAEAAAASVHAAANVRPVSYFGATTAALQAAFDWAHSSGGVLLQDNDITITTNVFHGNLRVRPAGGSWHVLADAAFVVNGGGVFGVGAGAWGDEAAILTRSCNGNEFYADALTTQYLVQIERGTRLTMAHTDNAAPAYPWRLIGLKEASYVYLEYEASDAAGILNTNAPDFYFFNRCTIGGRYFVDHTDDTAIGGLWIRDLNLGAVGEAYRSEIHLDDVFARTNGTDESIAIFNVAGTNGYMRCTGSLSAINYGNGFGASILNNQDMRSDQFSVALDRMDAEAEVKDGQYVVKIVKTAARINSLRAVLKDLEAGASIGGCFRSEYDAAVQAVPRINSMETLLDGVLACGDDVAILAYGDFQCDYLAQRVAAGGSTPFRGVSHNLRGRINGGIIANGSDAAAHLSNIGAATISGFARNCPEIDGALMVWDTDSATQAAAIDSNASWPHPNHARFKATIIASGTAAPNKVFSNSSASVRCYVDYLLQRSGAGGAVANDDTFALAPIEYTATHLNGTAVTRKTYPVA